MTAPTNVRARKLDGYHQVRVRWGQSSGAVVAYRILRNGHRIGRSTDLRFFDKVPAWMRRATYVVRAVDRWGHVSPKSNSYTLYWRR
jgi:hypothetical protein